MNIDLMNSRLDDLTVKAFDRQHVRPKFTPVLENVGLNCTPVSVTTGKKVKIKSSASQQWVFQGFEGNKEDVICVFHTRCNTLFTECFWAADVESAIAIFGGPFESLFEQCVSSKPIEDIKMTDYGELSEWT